MDDRGVGLRDGSRYIPGGVRATGCRGLRALPGCRSRGVGTRAVAPNPENFPSDPTPTPRLVSGSTVDTRQAPSHLVLEAVSVTLFGHPPTAARLELLPRSRGWRTRKAAIRLAIGLAVAPVVALVPPHAPWALISLVTGGILARRRWKERYTIQEVDAHCPRCEAALPLPSGTRLRTPHPVTCPDCGHEPVVEITEAELERAAGSAT